MQVKLLSEDDELYVFAESEARVAKKRAMRQRQLKWLWARLKQLAEMDLSREELLKHPVLGKQYAGEYPFQAGQPEEVRRAYAEAMGI